jgi:predicted transcriptional regulator
MAKPSKAPLIQEFINKNVNKVYSTKEMCAEIGVSLPTLLAFIKNNTNRFEQMQYGVYKITESGQQFITNEI